MAMIQSPEIEFAVAAVRESARLVQQIQRELVTSALTKDDKSPVTVADFAAQAVVAARLADRFPDAVLIGEESGDALRTNEGRPFLTTITEFVRRCFPDATPERVLEWIDRGAGQPPPTYWTLDPVDGTKGFLRSDQYAIALALVSGGKPQIGVLACPELSLDCLTNDDRPGALLVAQQARSAEVAPLVEDGPWTPLRVSSRTHPSAARLLRSVEEAHTDTAGTAKIAQLLGIEASPVPMDSQAKYALLAAGQGDVLLRLLSPSRPDYREKIWDQAAGSVIVEAAGGRVTDLDGRSLDFSHGRTLAKNRGIVATNGMLHDVVLAAIASAGC